MTDIEVVISHDGNRLAGSLRTTPPPPAPAALLISGSGPLDRNSNGKRMPLAVSARIAEHLQEQGVTTLRFDKRGIGASSGDYLAAGFHDNVADARAALAHLRSRPEVDPQRVFVIGHSEGALIAAELAADPDLAGVILLAGSAQPGRALLEWQARQIGPSLPRAARILMRVLRQDLVRTQTKRLDQLAASTDDVVRIQGVRVNARWFREFMAFDPAASLRAVTVPVLAVTGAKDVQVDPSDVASMSDLVPGSFHGQVIDDLDHLLRHDGGSKGVRGYKRQMRRPVDPRVLASIGDWIAERVGSADSSIS